MHSSNFYSDGFDGTVNYFPCPFCCVEVEVPVLCFHLAEEHCFDIKNAVCPVCAGNMGNDMMEHITVHHPHLFKRRKSQRINSCNPEPVGKKRGNASDSTPDPLLSSFIYNSWTDSKNLQEANSDIVTQEAISLHVESSDSSISNQLLEKDRERRSETADFLQQILLSTIF